MSADGAAPASGSFVLVVDDEVVIRDVATAILTRAGFEVRSAEHGLAALALFSQSPGCVSAVVLDESMPVLDGPATLRELRALRADLPVVISSGRGLDEERWKQVVGPRPLVLMKPYRGSALLEAVRQAIAAS